MNLLIDTEAFIYWTMQPEKLPPRALDAIICRENRAYISLVSPWEMQIKVKLNKLHLSQQPVSLVSAEVNNGAFTLLPIDMEHIACLAGLPDYHKDPFDRLLIAQAQHENLTIVTGDETIARYPVATLWK